MAILLYAGLAAGCLLAGKILIHYFQLESYQFPGYFRTIRRNFAKAFLPGLLLSLLFAVSFAVVSVASREFIWLHYLILSLILIAGGFAVGKAFSEKKAKKALVYTPRVKRLYIVSLIVFILILFLLGSSADSSGSGFRLWSSVASVLILAFPVFLPLWIALAGLLAWPLEKAISELYFRDAQRILRERKDLIRIGITGSWGKTSVKFILGTILQEKYHTLVTPASFNTPMGVTKIIRSGLEPGHRVFIAEMGARHVGDIREMCRLVHPKIGILTSVGPQHLDTFRTVERVAKTKYELIDAIPEDGFAVFADDGDIVRGLYEKTRKDKMLSGMDPSVCDVWAENIKISDSGSSFDLCSHSFRVPCRTVLLGELNIRNILACACVALRLGLSGDQIARGIEKIRPVEHRLQLITGSGGITVIDDAFNSNIRGAKQAFSVLKEMSGSRILVTPGMVELGEQEEEMNREFGRAAAECCDTAVLVGKKRSEAISAGMSENGFPNDRIIVVNSLEEAAEHLKSLARPGDTILFENDLPDNYTE